MKQDRAYSTQSVYVSELSFPDYSLDRTPLDPNYGAYRRNRPSAPRPQDIAVDSDTPRGGYAKMKVEAQPLLDVSEWVKCKGCVSREQGEVYSSYAEVSNRGGERAKTEADDEVHEERRGNQHSRLRIMIYRL